MKKENLVDLQKKRKFIGIKLSRSERQMIEEFCEEKEISISDLVRFSIKQVINAEKSKK